MTNAVLAEVDDYVSRAGAMDEARFINALRRACPKGIKENVPMSLHTTIGAGGPVRFFALPSSPGEVSALVRTAIAHGVEYLGVGRGSNLLVRDGGYDGLVIKVATNLGELRLYQRTAYAEAGVSFTKLGRVLTKNGRPGFEFAIGIPGSVGGAVRMNAGAFGSDLSRVVKSVKIVGKTGHIQTLKPEHLGFGYRKSSIEQTSIVLSARFHCPPGAMDAAELTRTLSRKDTQPLSDRSFGSTFTNPKGRFAAQMIEETGLKGHRRGGAMVSKKHANFIVNTGENTRANDVEDLIHDVIDRVKAKFNVVLKPEVIIVGNR